MVGKKLAVNIDDRFIKVDAPGIVWQVSHPLNVSDPVPHVRLVQEGAPNRKITLSVTALCDTAIYQKL